MKSQTVTRNGVPRNHEAEQVVLGCAIIEPVFSLDEVEGILSPEAFYTRAHRLIYQVLLEMRAKGDPIDVITLGNRIDERGILSETGGRMYLSELLSRVGTTSSIAYYAKIVKEKFLKRNLIQAGLEIAELGHREDKPIAEVMSDAEALVSHISQGAETREFTHLSTAIMGRLDDLEQGIPQGISTGFKELDKLTCGLQKGDLIIVAARPSMGKTSFWVSVARHAAFAGKKIGAFSIEMSSGQIIDRLIAQEARVNLLSLRNGVLKNDSGAWQSVMNAANRLSKLFFVIDDVPGIGMADLKSKARKMVRENKAEVIFVDYIQLIEGNKSDMREQEVAEISRGLKGLARELQIPVVVCAQLSRAVEKRDDKIPRLSDLRESGAIEQDADVVLFLYRDEYYEGGETSSVSEAKIIIGKQRNGPVGSVPILFHTKYADFVEPTSGNKAVEAFAD